MNEQELQSHYDKHLDYASVDHETILHQFYNNGDFLLDIGCGDGRLAKYIPTNRYLGFDYSRQRIEKAYRTFPNHVFICQTWQKFQSEISYDIVYCAEVLEHLDDPKACVEKFKKYVKQIFIATVPVNMPYVAHQHVYTTANEALALGFDSVILHKNHFILTWEPK